MNADMPGVVLSYPRIVGIAGRSAQAEAGPSESKQTHAIRCSSPRRSWRAERAGIKVVREREASGANGPTQTSGVGKTPSREAMLQGCARGDRTALHSLYRATAPQLFGLALSILRSRELAEDIMQDSFVLVWRHAHSFDPSRGSAMAWLARIVRNRCIDHLRHRAREVPLDHEFIQSRPDPASSPDDLAALSRDAQRLWECLGELEESPRKILLLVYYKGMTYNEVAGCVGAPLGTVKSWVRRSLVRLRGCMER
jgi:RNA polymerase sigma-70 factor, ECF subfamily